MVRVRYSFGSRHTGKLDNITKQKKKYPKIVEEVVSMSDIILQIIDARFVYGMRNIELEDHIKDLNKRLIYVVNKIDLLSKEDSKVKLPKNLRPFVLVSIKTGEGSKVLREKIRIEAKRLNKRGKDKVYVGVIGYPNVGKSSIINMLSRKAAAGISKQAGYTKGLQKIKMAAGIMILDTPGVIPETSYSTSSRKNIAIDSMFGARTYSDVKNPEEIVQTLIDEYPGRIENHFGSKNVEDVDDLIDKIGLEKNFIIKGGEVNSDRTARFILRQWQEGKVK